MANRHFAAIGDLWKHLLLAEVLRLRPPARYWETHAGSASYLLTDSSTRSHGAIRFLSVAPSDPDLSMCCYLEIIRRTPGIYPGSPMIAMQAIGRHAKYILCDVDPESTRTLRLASQFFDVEVVEADGIATIGRQAGEGNFEPSDVFVHIDPYEPFERAASDAMTPIELAGYLARKGHRLFYWYGYDAIAERGWARRAIARLAPSAPLWCGDVLVPAPFAYPERRGVWGCGVVLANMTVAEAERCSILGNALERVSRDDVVVDNEPARLAFAVIDS
jgi:hypothetical protein